MQFFEAPFDFEACVRSWDGRQEPGQHMIGPVPKAEGEAAVVPQVRGKIPGKAQGQRLIPRRTGQSSGVKSETLADARIERLEQCFFRREDKCRQPRGRSGQNHSVFVSQCMTLQGGKGLTLCHGFYIYTGITAPSHKAGHKAAGMADRTAKVVRPDRSAVGGTPYRSGWQRQMGKRAGGQQAPGEEFAKTTVARHGQRVRQWNAADVEQAAVEAGFVISGKQQHDIGATSVDPVMAKDKVGGVDHLILHQEALRTEHRIARKGQAESPELGTCPAAKPALLDPNRVLHPQKRVAGRADIRRRAVCGNGGAGPVTPKERGKR